MQWSCILSIFFLLRLSWVFDLCSINAVYYIDSYILNHSCIHWIHSTCSQSMCWCWCLVIQSCPVFCDPLAQMIKASMCNVGDLHSIPRSERSPREGNGNPLQYSCLENPMDGGAWQATVHGVAKSWTQLNDFTFTIHFSCTTEFTAAQFTIARTWKQPKGPSMEEWIKMQYIYTMKNYTDIKKNELMPYSMTWVDSENVTLNEDK